MKKELKIMIVEDDLIIGTNIMESLNCAGYAFVFMANEYHEAISLFTSELPDICILDINLNSGDNDGIALSNYFSTLHKASVIFLSSYSDDETIERMKSCNPSTFLIKPASIEQLQIAIELAVHNFERDKEHHQHTKLDSLDGEKVDYRFIKCNERYEKLTVSKVIYIKANGSYCEIVTEEKKLLISSNLLAILDSLAFANLKRCHRSFAVNIKYINAFNNLHVYLKHQDFEIAIPYSSKYREEIMHNLPKIKFV